MLITHGGSEETCDRSQWYLYSFRYAAFAFVSTQRQCQQTSFILDLIMAALRKKLVIVGDGACGAFAGLTHRSICKTFVFFR